jgi:hypothetical protein
MQESLIRPDVGNPCKFNLLSTEHLFIPNTKVCPKEVQFRQVSLYN